MGKRGLQDGDEGMDTKAQYGQRRTTDTGDVEMGEFEDPWEDEIEEEEIIEGDDVEDEDEGLLTDLEMRDIQEDTEVYLPSKTLDKDHVLMPDLSAYDMLHSMSVQWPFLSFDVIRDSLGDERRNVF
jgi:ribosome assembly protein RRB1